MSVSVMAGLAGLPNSLAYCAIPNGLWSSNLGGSRYVVGLNDSVVVKFRKVSDEGMPIDPSIGDNLTEYATWLKYEHTQFAQYFAQCFACSADGEWLIMEKVEPFGSYRDSDSAFQEAMEYLSIGDGCPMNYGRRADGSPVVLDYACSADVETNAIDRTLAAAGR